MRMSRVKAALRKDRPALFYCLHLEDPSVWEMASLIGPDCLWLDLEHHSHSLRTASELMRAARVGTSDVIARPAKGEFMRMQRMLESGAQGILYPRCDNAQEAQEAVQSCKFAPLGRRGCDGGNPDMPYLSMDIADYVRVANEETFLIIQIEDELASQEVEAILAVEGVDGAMLGPGDFSVLEGIPGQLQHEKIQQALDRIATAARNTGKHWGTTVDSVQRAEELVEAGARLLFTGADIVVIKNELEKIAEDWGSMGVHFENRLLP